MYSWAIFQNFFWVCAKKVILGEGNWRLPVLERFAGLSGITDTGRALPFHGPVGCAKGIFGSRGQ